MFCIKLIVEILDEKIKNIKKKVMIIFMYFERYFEIKWW